MVARHTHQPLTGTEAKAEEGEEASQISRKIMPIPIMKTWAVCESDLKQAWFRYSRKMDDIPDQFSYAFAQGWLANRGLNPDFNLVEFV